MWDQFICRVSVRSSSVSITLIWIKMIQRWGRKGRVVLKVPGEVIDQRSNHAEKLFYRMVHGGLVVGRINLEFLPELRQMEEHCFRFMGHRRSEEGNGLNDVVGNSFELLSWVN